MYYIDGCSHAEVLMILVNPSLTIAVVMFSFVLAVF